jgi:hypothetical protein
MAAGANPQMILQMLKSASGGGAPGGAPGAGATGAPGGAQDSVGPATRELQSANPEYALKLIQSLKKQIVELLPSLSFKAPAAARALMSTMKGVDAALKELQQANATLQAVGAPIDMSAIPRPQPPGGPSSPAIMNPANTGI